MCMCAGSSKKYLPKEEVVEVPDFRFIPEPQLSELVAYMRQRREHLVYHNTTGTDVGEGRCSTRRPRVRDCLKCPCVWGAWMDKAKRGAPAEVSSIQESEQPFLAPTTRLAGVMSEGDLEMADHLSQVVLVTCPSPGSPSEE
jgi:hypothetical protein